MQDAMANLANEVAKMKAEILGKINEFPKQVEEVVSKEMLVFKRAITEDLWKVAWCVVRVHQSLKTLLNN